MERLTIKYKDGSYGHITGSDWYNFEDDYDKLFNKLGSLEDLQDELGIPLEVLFKALKDGIWTSGYEKRDSKKIWLRNFNGKLLFEVSNRFCFDLYYLEDYGKTWWLEKPEVNENE